ncbi:MAG: hypothetical protein PHN37_02190 [Candidatus Pacebacteria bacterium]|nr:hypothetical protein [Candidatus Paceibacterota bacterium]
MNKGFFSPTIILMILIALIMDTISLVLLLTGLDLLSFLNIIGGFFLGGLMFAHTGTFLKKKDSKKITEEISKKIIKKLGLASLGEIIPIIGGIIPVWSLSVYSHLRNSKQAE